MKIMRVKQQDGTLVDIPIGPGVSGADGKSAYEYAKEGGFEGTEADFIQAMNRISWYSYGTKDLEAGVSLLETGKLYFVYE